MNEQIANPKTEVPSGIKMNDKDYITGLLSCLKNMEKNYAIAMTEASNENLYNKYQKSFTEIADLQRATYQLMFRNGWYNLEKAESMKINKKHQMLMQEYQQLGM